MRPTIALLLALVLVSLISVFAVAAGPGQYPITVTVAPLPPTSAAMQGLQGKSCSYNCYTGDVECKSRQARNLQLAESSDGNTYELRCVSGVAGAACPVAFGTYPARRVNQQLQVLVPAGQTSMEQTFSILSVRPSQMGKSSAAELHRCRELLAQQ